MLYLADHDLVTRVLNHRRFEDELARQLAETQRYGTRGAVLFIDADGFKEVNDRWGHRVGDAVLADLARVLEGVIATRATVGRLGGDEFGAILPNKGPEEAQGTAESVVAAVRTHEFPGPSEPVRITVSVGVAFFPDDGTTTDEILVRADEAMYDAKASGGDGWHRHEGEDRRSVPGKASRSWEDTIQQALAADRLLLFCQPIVELVTGRVAMYELLVRVQIEEDEVLPPAAFLEAAERTGAIHRIDRWVLRQAIHLLASQQRAGRQVRLAVNVSGRAFEDRGLLRSSHTS
ncbi:hypothetical protein caldi_14150 [Caldinitratiruptor microaerophilus]|uniref:Diguanylate cyclase (GGDEF) domain-containing protein n=2 Tax=Caldinitratiruptor microaerophilus TaxID=671077 RepID=A0AA35CN28_9FIRM|nr:hypothetical protein caldi_14150 [Caldinitratiruptor microaerophilus]